MVFTQSKTNSEIPKNILALPVSLCTVETYNYDDSVVICGISIQTLLESGAHIVDNKATFPFSVYVCRAYNDKYNEITVIAQSETRAKQMAKDYFNSEPELCVYICGCSAKQEYFLTRK